MLAADRPIDSNLFWSFLKLCVVESWELLSRNVIQSLWFKASNDFDNKMFKRRDSNHWKLRVISSLWDPVFLQQLTIPNVYIEHCKLTQVLPYVFFMVGLADGRYGRYRMGMYRMEIQCASCSAHTHLTSTATHAVQRQLICFPWFSLQNAMADAEGLRHVITLVECKWSATDHWQPFSSSLAVACARNPMDFNSTLAGESIETVQ